MVDLLASWRDTPAKTSIVEFVSADGLATGVRLEDDTVLPADLVLVAVGAYPRCVLCPRLPPQSGLSAGLKSLIFPF